MVKNFIALMIALSVTMCATPTPAKYTWPSIEKQKFRQQCVISLKEDPSLLDVFSESMLQSVCACLADRWENDVDWPTFTIISKAPLHPDVEQKFFIRSYKCALETLGKFKV